MNRYRILTKNEKLKLKVFGSSLEEFFINAGVGISNFFYKDSGRFIKRARGFEKIKIEAKNSEELLSKYLEELIKISKKEKKVFPRIKILRISPKLIEAQIFGLDVKNFDNHLEGVGKVEIDINNNVEGVVVLNY